MVNTSRYFNNTSITIPLLVTSGIPYFEAVLVNDTNTEDGDFSNAVWQPYTSSNITVNLNEGEASYNVWIGLRGWPANAGQTWVGTEVWLRTNAPVITITKPVGSTVTQPIIQLQGLVSETLSKLTYDISNAQGVITNQPGQWTALFFDTNISDFTTNFFQCYDVPLTNGVNSITVHAMDSAGNCSTTNVSFTLDYSAAVPPSLTLLWPTNGMCICGTNFTVQGQLDDDTATVMAQVVDSSGNTNTVQGLVERSGLVWAQNLPLALGTNILTITATNAAGLSTTTNLTLMQSRVLVTINPLTQFNQAAVSVTGTISDPTCSLTVNGTNAYYLDTNGDWEADGVLVNPTGTATLNVQVFTGDPILVGSQDFDQPQPLTVEVANYSHDVGWFYIANTPSGPGIDYEESLVYWNSTNGGFLFADGELNEAWTANVTPGQPRNSQFTTNLPADFSVLANLVNGDVQVQTFFENVSHSELDEYGPAHHNAHCEVTIQPSGQARFGQKVLYLVQAQVSGEYGSPTPALNKLQIQGQTLTLVTNSDGSVWGQTLLIAPTGTPQDVTPSGFPGNFTFNVTATAPVLQIVANGTPLDPVTTNAEFCVGQQLVFSNSFNPPIGNYLTNTAAKWVFTGSYVNTNSGGSSTSSTNYFADAGPLQNPVTSAWWISGGTNCMANDIQVISSDFSGKAKLTQLCTINSTGLGFSYTGALDGSDPYNPTGLPSQAGCIVDVFTNPAAGANTLHFDDAPDANDLLILSTIMLNDSFVDYIMFNPDPAGSGIFVPITQVKWNVSASATYPSTNITQNAHKGPHGPTISEEFPKWTTVK